MHEHVDKIHGRIPPAALALRLLDLLVVFQRYRCIAVKGYASTLELETRSPASHVSHVPLWGMSGSGHSRHFGRTGRMSALPQSLNAVSPGMVRVPAGPIVEQPTIIKL